MRQGQSDDGGWGPRVNSPPEPFDTALAILALVQGKPLPDVKNMIARGRGISDRPATEGRKLDGNHPAGGRCQLCTEDLDGGLGDSCPPGQPRVFNAGGRPIQNGSSTVWVVTRPEIGPAASTSNGRATLFPAMSSSSVPITRQ